jgi:hypothetical protein
VNDLFDPFEHRNVSNVQALLPTQRCTEI